MPQFHKRKLARFIKAVIDNEAETKRLVQTSENWYPNDSDFQSHPIDRQNGNATDWFSTADPQNYYCWTMHSNTPTFWPVDFMPMTQGVAGGHEGTSRGLITTTLQDNASRIGTEVKIKGISLEFMTWLKPQLPFANLKVSLIKYAKGDAPDINSLYKRYTEVKPLDMMDTRRFKVLKQWKFFHRQSQPTTAGSEMASQMFTGNNMNSDAYDGDKFTIVQDLGGKTWAEWETYVTEMYPDHRIWSYDDLPYNNDVRTAMEAKLMEQGLSSTLETGIVRYAPSTASFQPQQKYGVFRDNGDVGTNGNDPLMLAAYTYVSSSHSMVTESMTTSPNVSPQQILLVRKAPLSAKWIGPTQGQIMVPMDKKHKLWIPGYLFGNGGNIKYKEQPTLNEHDYQRDGFFDYVLMFETYTNFKTWDYDTTGSWVGTTYPEVFRMSDFLQVTYFKDF